MENLAYKRRKIMINNSDLDAVESGYREAREVVEPVMKLAKQIFALLAMSKEAIKKRLEKKLEKDPDDFIKDVSDMQSKIKNEYEEQEKTAIENGQPKLANELREAMTALDNDISIKKIEIKELKENGQNYSQKLDELSENLHAMGAITLELEQGNQELDYSKTAENVREILDDTSIDTSKLQLYKNVEQNKSNEKVKTSPENIKSNNLDEKFQDAIKRATQINTENVKTQVQNVTKNITERSL